MTFLTDLLFIYICVTLSKAMSIQVYGSLKTQNTSLIGSGDLPSTIGVKSMSVLYPNSFLPHRHNSEISAFHTRAEFHMLCFHLWILRKRS